MIIVFEISKNKNKNKIYKSVKTPRTNKLQCRSFFDIRQIFLNFAFALHIITLVLVIDDIDRALFVIALLLVIDVIDGALFVIALLLATRPYAFTTNRSSSFHES